MDTGTPRPTILLADDDPFITALYRERLTKQGMEVDTVQDGEEALRWLQSRTPDMMLLDLNMPRLDGTEVLRYIREQSGFPQLPVVVLSNACAPEFIEQVSKLKPTRFLVKYDNAPNKVVQTVLEVVEETRRGEVPSPAPADIRADEAAGTGASLREIIRQLEQVEEIETQRELLLALYRGLQEPLKAFKACPPLSTLFLLSEAVEPVLEYHYERTTLLPSSSLAILHLLARLIEEHGDKRTDIPLTPALLLVHTPDPDDAVSLRSALDRPGLIPVTVSRDDAAWDLLAYNRPDGVVWAASRRSAARRALKTIRATPQGERVSVIFILPEEDVDPWYTESADTNAWALSAAGAASEAPLLIYALLLNPRFSQPG